MTVLPKISAQEETIRFTASLFSYSGLVAQIVLLQQFSTYKIAHAEFILPIFLSVAFLCGYSGIRWEILSGKNKLLRIYQGFLINALGLLFLVLASHDVYNGLLFFSGVIISGLGSGVVCIATMNRNKNKPSSSCLYKFILLSAGTVLSVAVCLIVRANFTVMTGFPYAFSLLFDLSLLGAIYVKITEHDY